MEEPDSSDSPRLAVAGLTAFTMVAFAANSLFCRMALGRDLVDPVSFTTLRLVSGALALALIVQLVGRTAPGAETSDSRREPPAGGGSWASGAALFAYAAAFSLAYVSLSTGMGALILFGSVQVTMLAFALRSGERLRPRQWAGLGGALLGLVYLVSPGLTAPSPVGALLMATAGFAWGVYSIRGRGSAAPVRMTAGNFGRAAPLAALLSLLALPAARIAPTGAVLALVSGVVTSGLGYVLWYRALRGLTTTQASVVQLTVPVIAAFGGVVLLSEEITVRLVAGSALVLGGVAAASLRRSGRPAADAGEAAEAGGARA